MLFDTIHPALLLNYDQLWKLAARGSKFKYFKDSNMAGKRKVRDPTGKFIWTQVDEGCDEESGLPDRRPGCDEGSGLPDRRPAKPSKLHQQPVHDPVGNARQPHTLCTSTWSDGTQGPLLSVWKEGSISQEVINRINSRYAGRMLVMVTRSDTHFMNGELTVRYLEELVGPALRAKRNALGLDATARAGLLADAFTGNSSAEQEALRVRWCNENNVTMMSDIPGGWSKNGQPCDKFHAMFRRLTDIWEDMELMYQPDIMSRPLLSEMLHGFNSIGKKSLPPEVGYHNNANCSTHCFPNSSSQSIMLSAHHYLGVFPVTRSESGHAQKQYILAFERVVDI
jgi:hypothetical protein